METKALAGWQQTLNVIAATLAMTIEKQNATPSTSPEHAELQKVLDRLFDDFKTHSMSGFKIVDASIGAGTAVKALAEASKKAKSEADRIKNATKSVKKLTDLAGELSKIVLGFARL